MEIVQIIVAVGHVAMLVINVVGLYAMAVVTASGHTAVWEEHFKRIIAIVMEMLAIVRRSNIS
jgi:hypothetical protein